MKAEIAEVFMNPVRQRIIQYLLVHEKGTVKEIKKNCRMGHSGLKNVRMPAQNMEIKNCK